MNADRIAPVYRWIEHLAFGGALQRCRCAHLKQISPSSHILIFGEGDGRFLAALLPHLSAQSTVDVIEASQQMIALAKRRIPSNHQATVRFFPQRADAKSLPQPHYDVVVTNFFLDCLTQDEATHLISNVANHLRPGALWIVGEFHVPAQGPRRWHATLWLRTMYLFFRATTGLVVREIPDYRSTFRQAGLEPVHQQQQRLGLITSELWRKPGQP